MNGQFSSIALPAYNPGTPRFSGRRLTVSARLVASLTVSCLLHAAVVLLPYIGESRKESRFAEKGGQKLPRAFSASITSTKKIPFSVAQAASEGENIPELPAPARMADADSHTSSTHTAGADLLPIPAPDYYTTDRLTKRPQPTGVADLDKPETSTIIASGKMVLILWIDDLGDVVDVLVEQSELPEVISRSAVEAFRRLHFVPGELKGRRVGSVMRIEITYDDGRKPPS